MIERDNYKNTRTYPSSKGFRIDEAVTVPITQEKNLYLEYTKLVREEVSKKADVEIFAESSKLSNTEAKRLSKEFNFKEPVRKYGQVDPDTGRIHLYSKPTPTRIP